MAAACRDHVCLLSSVDTQPGLARGQVVPKTLPGVSLPPPRPWGKWLACSQGLCASGQQASFLVRI
jgi:hypothetical protein